MNIIKIVVGQLQANCFLLADQKTKQTLIIDPGDDADLINQTITDNKLKPVVILATHGHFDHVVAAFELQENYQIPFYIHPKDQFLLDRLSQTASHFLGRKVVAIPPKKILHFDNDVETRLIASLPKQLQFKTIHTPGHTPGSVCFYFPSTRHPERSEVKRNEVEGSHQKTNEASGSVFAGDLIFADGGYGRTDFSYCSFDDLKKSIAKIMKLPKETKIYSGHGEESEIGKERFEFI
jgi:hydroxyacylglutathione hydrolase